MNTIPAIQSGIQSFNTAYAGVVQSSSQIAQNSTQSTANLTGALVEMKAHEQQALAAVKLIETSHDMIGSLLSIKV